MINGSQQIIGNVPGQYLNPLLVAESQAADHTGFIVVTYELDPRQFDVLFLQGRVITHCARMNKDLRFFIDQHDVTTTFRDRHSESMVSLFVCDLQSIQRFIATFHSEPCLKVHVDALTKPQILALIKSTGCSQGIIERNDFSASMPIIELKEIESASELPVFTGGFKRGRLLVYDLVKNREIQSHRFTPIAVNDLGSVSRKRRRRRRDLEASLEDQQALPSTSVPTPENPAEAIEALANEILGATQSAIDDCPLTNDNSPSAPGPQSSVTNDATIADQRSPNNKPDTNDSSQSPQPETSPTVQPAPEETVPTQEPGHPEPSPFTRVLERALRSVKQQIVEASPQRAESIFAQAEKKILMLNPDFNFRTLDDTTAIITLDLIEEMIKQSPLLKRSRLRESATELVSDLYNKQYELLEDHNAVDSVEQCYYRLKGSKS
ncbi:MAG: hypothetical protein HY961_09715 [Ignavibacteriae bacterium]|nr:hypothetical protein [Ignavibacteriota bacterium]